MFVYKISTTTLIISGYYRAYHGYAIYWCDKV